MHTLERAVQIASEAHAGAVDKAGEPYVRHPLRVMLQVDTPEQRIAAVLHDVVEDTPWTLDFLRSEGFPPENVGAVDALTKRTGESRLEAAKRAAVDPIARRVKLADDADNLDLERITDPTQRDFDRLLQYREVRALLESHS
ncbi:MAG: bifunctional (p)ppGpp synthetase/guanosine-3',5'-bis(diphosphate) 3'-pyrophosphohydrolase [Gemmatimonadaceae bacterium]|nr:bifunctional (p)ppGpp synthetase/guanosine-3',5'-bis(diphosphate) 3'-pyrophosphohydrolase [Gemmatimonadaceae bacterium]